MQGKIRGGDEGGAPLGGVELHPPQTSFPALALQSHPFDGSGTYVWTVCVSTYMYVTGHVWPIAPVSLSPWLCARR